MVKENNNSNNLGLIFIGLMIFVFGILSLGGTPSIFVAENKICDPVDDDDCMGVEDGRGEVVVRPQEKLPKVLEFSQVTSGLLIINETGEIDQRWILLNAGHGVIAGDRLALIDGTRIYGGFAQTVVGQNISLDTPLDFNYSAGAFSVTLTRDMNIDGSVTPQIFQIGTTAGVNLEITRIIFSMTDGTAGDDTTFGGCPPLTNGVVLRFADGATYNIFNAKTNGELTKITGGDFTYADRAGAGDFGFSARLTFNGQDKLDTVIMINSSEELQIIIQDDLTCLTNFNVVAEGNTDIFTLQ